MAAAREREAEQARSAVAEPEAPVDAPAAAPVGPVNPVGVMALQRLVGNAAVAEYLDERRDPAAAHGAPGATPAADSPAAASSGAPGAGASTDAPAPDTTAPGGGAAAGEQSFDLAGAASGAVGALPGGAGVLAAFEAIVRGTNAAPEGAAAPGAAPGAPAGGAAAGTAGPNAAGATAASAAAGAQAGAAAGGAAAAGAAAPQAAAGGAAAPQAAAAGAEQASSEPAGPAPSRAPSEDPNFQAMKGKAGAAGGQAKAHQPAAAGASAAQAAAQPPGNDIASQAAGHQVEEMGKQQPGVFDKKAFVAAVKKAIEAAAPKNLEEADEFKESGKAGQVKDEVGGLVKGGKQDSEKDIKQATDAPPDASKAQPKPVVPLAPDEAGAPASTVGAAGAMPGPRPEEETDLSQGPAQVEQQMDEAEVTEEQLQKSNEPEFTGALEAKQEAKDHATAAPQEYRAQEGQILASGREEAAAAEQAGLKGMHGSKVEAIAKVAGQKGEAKSQDESKRTKVASDIQAIYDKTKTEVTAILTGLDGKVEATFTRGEAAARQQFEDFVGAKMEAYKDDRYSGWLGGARWLKDKLFGMPDEVNVFYSQGRDAYLTSMDGVIGEVADLVGSELNAARMKIAAGRAEVHDYVTQLPQDLQKVGKDAEGKLDQQWDDLSSEVDNKQDSMVDSIAQKYVASRDALDSRIEEMKAANRGLVDKALDAVVGVIKTILKLKDMLLNVLAKAADVIGDIISDPIGFLGNLIGGIKDGLSRFVDNIGTHLQNGLMGWLFGALGDAGIKMPATFDLAGIFELVMDVLGLTYRSIRGRVAKIVGEPVVAKMEQTVDVFKILLTKGAAGLWEWIKEKLGDLQELLLGGLKDFIIERVIKGGITWLLSLLNPAAAFIKACKAIYDIVMFIVERGSQIMEFVNSVLDSIGAIARGQLSVAAEKVESALAKALPLAISFLASLLGLGGITDKIREGIDKVRKPIEKAVDFVVMGAVKGFKKLFGGAIGWVKGKYEKGKQWATDKAEAGKAWVKGKAQGIKDRFTGGDKETDEAAATPEEEAGDIKVQAGREVRKRTAGKAASIDSLRDTVGNVLSELRPRGLQDLQAVPRESEPAKADVLARTTSDKVGEVDIPPETEEEKLFDDGKHTLEERRKLLASARAKLNNEETMAWIFQAIRDNKLAKDHAAWLLEDILSDDLKYGFKLRCKDAVDPDKAPGKGEHYAMDYFGIFDDNGEPSVGLVDRGAPGWPVGWAYTRPAPDPSDPTGATVIEIMALDFLVNPSIERAKIKGVGSEMMKRAHERYKNVTEGAVGEWYTLKIYEDASTGRPGMSTNLATYMTERKAGKSMEEAALETWTAKRIKKLYGDAELDVKVTEYYDINGPLPVNKKIVEAVFKPR